jgi:putative hydrolase of the HAD superfamily
MDDLKSNGRTFKTARNELLGNTIAPEMDPSEFDTLVRATDRSFDRIAETRGTDVMFAERVNLVAEAANKPHLSDDLIEELYIRQSELFTQHPPTLLDPNTPELLDKLSNHVDLAVVSNTGFIHGKEMRKALGQLGILDKFQTTIFSNEVGYAKPHPAIYTALQEQSGISHEATTHIGDNYHADVLGARALGMNAIHFDGATDLKAIVESMEE